MKVLLLISSIFCVCEPIRSAEIFAVIPSPFYSHQATFRPLWRRLASQGHRITLMTTDLMEVNENITQIDISKSYEVKNEFQKLFGSDYKFIDIISKLLELRGKFLDNQLAHPDFVRLIENKTRFDLVFVEVTAPIFPLFVKAFHCPFIGLTTMDALPFVHGAVGNSIHPAIYPYADFGFGTKLSFKERLISTAVLSMSFVLFPTIFRSVMNDASMKYLGEKIPDVYAIYQNASLIFNNANPVFFPTRPITPLTVNLGGGLHLRELQELPKDLQTYLDESKDGCIYFSFGSTVNSNYLGEEKIEIFRKTFEDLAPIRVLWKFENDTLANKPRNLEIRKWLPQQDILRHPNVKMFITQGGLQSMEEAIDSAVPMLGMPFYGDQLNNVKKMVLKKFGVELDVKTMTLESLKASILEVLKNPLYKKNIDRLSAISKDQPMRGLEKAVWWTEYVLRHGGTEHLRSPSIDIPLYQYLFLDIIAFVSVVFIFLIVLSYYLFKFIRVLFRKIFSKKNKEKVN